MKNKYIFGGFIIVLFLGIMAYLFTQSNIKYEHDFANIKKTVLPVRKMVISTVKNGRLQNFFSPILSITLLDTTLQWSLLVLAAFCH